MSGGKHTSLKVESREFHMYNYAEVQIIYVAGSSDIQYWCQYWPGGACIAQIEQC